MDANTSMESQPLLVEYTPNNPSEFFFPMMDVHGDDVVDSVVFRDHLIGLASPTPLKGDSEQFEGIDNRFFAHDYFWDYTQVKGRVKNGDMVIKHTPEEEKKLHLSYKFLAV
jgi:hypothetical protein